MQPVLIRLARVFFWTSVLVGLIGLAHKQNVFGSRTTLNVPQFAVWLTGSPQVDVSQTQKTLAPPPTQDTLKAWLAELRTQQASAEFASRDDLDTAATALAQDALQHNSVTSDKTEAMIRKYVSPLPAKSDILQAFIPDPEESNSNDWRTTLQNETLLTDPTATLFGVGTAEGELDGVPGTLIVIIASVPRTQLGTAEGGGANQEREPIVFTSDELWEALQNYRRAHQLPIFEKRNRLCDVAQDRLAEQVALGKLDAHAGFDARADRFFEENTGWRSLNENLASGYRTAVQTVEWGWDQSLGHQALMKNTDHPYACTAAQDGFAVLITGS